MFIIDGVYRNVDISGLSAPILEGTVLTETGAIASADGSDAFGIVPQNIYEIPPTKLASVVVGGTIDLRSPANANVEFSEAVMKALGADINFVQNSEAAEGVGGSIQIIRPLKIKDLPPVPDGWTPSDAYDMEDLESDAVIIFSPDVEEFAVVENSGSNITLKPTFMNLTVESELGVTCAPCAVKEEVAPYTPVDDSGQNDPCWITANVIQLSVLMLVNNTYFAAIDTNSVRWARVDIQ